MILPGSKSVCFLLRIRRHIAATGCFLLVYTLSFSQTTIPPIGQWREHLNYQSVIQVLKGDKIYCATTTNLFSVDNNAEIERYSKVNGLNDIGVRCIGWDATTRQLVIAYNNSNIDALNGSIVKNIGDIKRSGIAGNKTIFGMYCKDGLAYLCSGLGIIVANLSKYEIKDTWFIGNNGSQVKISGMCSDASFFYAATDEGLKRAPVNAADLSNYNNWSTPGNGLPAGAYSNVIFTNNSIITQKNDSLFINNNNNWTLLYSDPAWPITSITSSGDKILVCQRTVSGDSRVAVMNTSGIIEKIIAQSGIISYPLSAILDNNAVWTADQFGGLSEYTTSFERFIPNGPLGPASGEMLVDQQTLYAAAGAVNDSWNYLYDRDGLYQYKDNNWTYRGFFNLPVLDSVLDFITVAVDPADQSVWAGSYGGGLVHFKDAQTTIFKKNNSTLQAAIGDPASCRVSGLAFDRQNNLWISNYGAPQNLQVRKQDGTWKAFSIPFTHLENAVSQVLVDDQDQLWIVSPKGNGVFCYNHGQSIDNLSDDRWKFYQQGTGNGNLPSNNVFCLAKDKSGYIWVGTDMGIGIIQCTPNVFDVQGCDATLPVVQQGQFAGLLFKDEIVQCIAVDGANRKWVGTKNGLWLISPEGNQIIYQFTEDNSPLLGNDVKRIAIDGTTGEVFIATFNGICSFRSTATEGTVSNQQVLVFPNPVPPGYNGTIAVRGLADNALVKITEMNGRLVYQTRALGGQAIWDGHNYKGDKAASGIYLVIVRDDSGTEKTVTKIVITSGR